MIITQRSVKVFTGQSANNLEAQINPWLEQGWQTIIKTEEKIMGGSIVIIIWYHWQRDTTNEN